MAEMTDRRTMQMWEIANIRSDGNSVTKGITGSCLLVADDGALLLRITFGYQYG